jgi:tetratricopeptide (TPR) repeat protein
MKKVVIIYIYLSTLILGVSCQRQETNIESLLEKANLVLDSQPDSTLTILEEIPNPQSLKKSLYYEYYLVQIQAKYKSYRDITADTLVFAIRDYYTNRNNIEKTAMATFYSGRIFQERKEYKKALQQFLYTRQILAQSENLNLKGLCQNAIGDMYSKQLLEEKAIIEYKLSREYFHQAKEFKNEIIVCNLIGNSLLIKGKTDSAFAYYNEALDLATKYDYKKQQASIRMNMGVAYRETGNWQQAENHFKQALEYSTDSVYRAKLAANFADIYQQQGKNDSAIVYLQKALNLLPREQNNFVAANIFKRWSAVEENKKNYAEALEKHKLYSKHVAKIIKDNENAAILEMEKKYNFQLIENQNKQLLIDKQRILLLSLGLLLFLALLFLLMLRRTILKERKLKEAERKIYQMKEMARNFNEKENSYRNVLIQHFEILKKAALLEGYMKENEKGNSTYLLQKFNEVVYGEKSLNWDVLYQTLNKLGEGIFDRIKTNYPQLNESEFRICCLAYVDFDNAEIALLLNYRINTVEVKKSSIRKKLEIKAFGSIQDFLQTNINTKEKYL